MKSIFKNYLLICNFVLLSASFTVAEELYNPALVTSYGKPLVTLNDLIYAAKQLEKEQPYLQKTVSIMTKDDQLNFYEQLVTKLCNQKIAYNYLKKNGLDSSENFKTMLNKKLSELPQGILQSDPLLLPYIEEAIALDVFKAHLFAGYTLSDAEAEIFYNNNIKALPDFQRAPFITVLDGVKTYAVQVDDQFEAQYLLEKAIKTDIKKAAVEMHKNVLELGILSQYEKSVDPALLQKGEEMELIPKEAFPVWDIVQSADKRFFYVVFGLMRTDPKYAPFSQVKNAAKGVIKTFFFESKYDEELKRLYQEMKIIFDKEILRKYRGQA